MPVVPIDTAVCHYEAQKNFLETLHNGYIKQIPVALVVWLINNLSIHLCSEFVCLIFGLYWSS